MELDQELLTQVLVALAALLGGALGLALTALVLKYAATWFKDFAAVVRRYEPQVVEAVDEPGDMLIVNIDRLLDRVHKYEWDVLLAKTLPALISAAADAIAAAEPGVPLPEREGEAAPK